MGDAPYNPFAELLASQGSQPQAPMDTQDAYSPYPEPPTMATPHVPPSAAAQYPDLTAAPRPANTLPAQGYPGDCYDDPGAADYHYSEKVPLTSGNAVLPPAMQNMNQMPDRYVDPSPRAPIVNKKQPLRPQDALRQKRISEMPQRPTHSKSGSSASARRVRAKGELKPRKFTVVSCPNAALAKTNLVIVNPKDFESTMEYILMNDEFVFTIRYVFHTHCRLFRAPH